MSLAISLVVVVYLRPHLCAILVELCGTVERAAFWVAFTNIAVCLFPLVFAIYGWPQIQEPRLAVHELGTQVGAALIGLLAAVITLGIVLSMSIAARDRRTATLPRE